MFQTVSFEESTKGQNPEGLGRQRKGQKRCRFIKGFRLFGHRCLSLQREEMVLSNKKLKQKLRAALAESLAVSVAGTTDPSTTDSTSTNPDPNPQSLKNLLGSATQIPRLSKREKRRKILSLQGPELAGTSNQSEEKEANTEALTDDGNNTENKDKKKKKRKRDGEVEDGEVGLEENKNKKLKKRKNKKKKKKKQKSEGQNKGVENEGGEKGAIKETAQISDR